MQSFQALRTACKTRKPIWGITKAILLQLLHTFIAHQFPVWIYSKTLWAAERMNPNAAIAVHHITRLIGLHQFNASAPHCLLQRVHAGLGVVREHRHIKRRRFGDPSRGAAERGSGIGRVEPGGHSSERSSGQAASEDCSGMAGIVVRGDGLGKNVWV
nr:hypothetical protein Iba_chr09bCG9060 [Ipomoea batatas]